MRLSYPAYFFLSFGLFAAFIVTLVIKTMYVNNELVSEDYYQQELGYQSTLDKMGPSSMNLEWNDSSLVLSFPKSNPAMLYGTVVFYRPSDASKDLKTPIQLTEGKQYFLRQMFIKGLYKIKVDWTENGNGHYREEDLYVK